MIKYKTVLLILITTLFLFSTGKSEIIYTPLETMSSRSFDIIEGKVQEVVQKWDEEHKFIYTYITIQVHHSYKDKLNGKVTLKQIGGSLDGFTTHAPSQPAYSEGEDVLVFLNQQGDFYETFGLVQGKFNVSVLDSEKIVKRDLNINELLIFGEQIKKDSIETQMKYKNLRETITC